MKKGIFTFPQTLFLKLKTMIIELSDTMLTKAGLTETEIRLLLAIQLFEEELMTLGQASQLAELHQIMFQKELAKRKIPIHYDVEDFERDLETIKSI